MEDFSRTAVHLLRRGPNAYGAGVVTCSAGGESAVQNRHALSAADTVCGTVGSSWPDNRVHCVIQQVP